MLNGLRIKIMHNMAPINLQSSIIVTGVSRRLNVCLILTDLVSLLFALVSYCYLIVIQLFGYSATSVK